ncbi:MULTISPECIES: uroporphyrinogen-III synthase [Azospirillum]|uniref:Uroporphyrinogen-III synthase n=1 Tax=Azospirillum brasilense TaxID=192 RepID=A0ABU4PKW6_AZOBR|nr:MULTISPECIES: uroporphyrinogen-III synthase [Azospirillum]MDX5955937.1 uroporphyrinogen-III synthase [Azospirillum brasilense]PWC82936.1 hypothetical protein AEJ54_31325 [Azospirillum sp. Sp 7]
MSQPPTILLTRPVDDAEPLRGLLSQRGYRVMTEPLLSICWLVDREPVLDDVQALLFTSVNGVRAFARVSRNRTLRAFTVGNASAAAARRAGFAAVESAEGDVAALAALVRRRCDPTRGALFYAAANAVAGDLVGVAATDGFTVRKEILYEAVPATTLSAMTTLAIADGRIAGVVAMSPRTARSFVDLVAAAGLLERCRTLDLIALSRAVAAAVTVLPDGRTVPWRTERIAAQPNLTSLLDLLPAVGTV